MEEDSDDNDNGSGEDEEDEDEDYDYDRETGEEGRDTKVETANQTNWYGKTVVLSCEIVRLCVCGYVCVCVCILVCVCVVFLLFWWLRFIWLFKMFSKCDIKKNSFWFQKKKLVQNALIQKKKK